MKLTKSILVGITLLLTSTTAHSGTYTIDGTFDGCEHGKLYPLLGGGILECLEYNYFYEYMPEVRTDGREVILIGDEKVSGKIHDGSVIKTQIDGEFEGCDFDKSYFLTNGLVFSCSTYSYSYSYMPQVTILLISGRSPVVYIDGEEYDGSVYQR